MTTKSEATKELKFMVVLAYCLDSVQTATQGEGIQVKPRSLTELR